MKKICIKTCLNHFGGKKGIDTKCKDDIIDIWGETCDTSDDVTTVWWMESMMETRFLIKLVLTYVFHENQWTLRIQTPVIY